MWSPLSTTLEVACDLWCGQPYATATRPTSSRPYSPLRLIPTRSSTTPKSTSPHSSLERAANPAASLLLVGTFLSARCRRRRSALRADLTLHTPRYSSTSLLSGLQADATTLPVSGERVCRAVSYANSGGHGLSTARVALRTLPLLSSPSLLSREAHILA